MQMNVTPSVRYMQYKVWKYRVGMKIKHFPYIYTAFAVINIDRALNLIRQEVAVVFHLHRNPANADKRKWKHFGPRFI